jgi:hypothetical protein
VHWAKPGGFGGISRDILPDILIELSGVHVVEHFQVHRSDFFDERITGVSLWLILGPLRIEKTNPVW